MSSVDKKFIDQHLLIFFISSYHTFAVPQKLIVKNYPFRWSDKKNLSKVQ